LADTRAEPEFFVGREDELVAVEASLRAAVQGRGTLVVLSGEAGAGKTRILERALRTARASKFAVAAAANYEHARTPFGPFVEVLRGLAAQIPDVVPANAGDRAAYERFAGLTTTDGEAAPLDKRRMFVLVAEGLERAAVRAPLALAFDDAQWSDPETLELLHFLAPRLATVRAVVFITVRAESPDDAAAIPLRALEAYPFAVTIPIPPLPMLMVREMIVAATPSARELTGAMVDEICRRSEGNPLFVTELVRQAVSSRTAALLPPTIQLGVSARLRALDGTHRHVLEVASVFGRSFGLSDVVAVAETTRAAVLGALRAARDAGIVEERSRDGETFDFRHELVRAAVYETLLAAERTELHRRIADRLEASSDTDSLPSALLAYHWARAGDDAGVARFAERAGDEALCLNAAASARDRYEDALGAGALDAASRARIEAKLAEAFNQLGDVANAGGYAASAAAYYRDCGDVAEAARLDLEVAKLAYRGGHADETIAVCRRILASKVTGPTRFGANARAAICFAYRNDLPSARELIAAADACEGPRNPRDSVALEWARAMTAMYAHDDTWLDAAHKALVIAEELGDPGVLAPTLLNFAGMATESGREEVAASALDRAIEVADANGRTFHSAYARCSRALTFRNAGRLDDAYRAVLEVAAMYVDAAIVRINAAAVGLATLADTDRLGKLPKLEDPEILEEAFATGESGRFAPLAASHVLAAIVRGDASAAAALIKRALSGIDVATYTSDALCTFARFGDADDIAAIVRLFPEPPASGPARLHYLFAQTCSARASGDAAGARTRGLVCADAAQRAGAPLLRAAAYEAAGDTKEALAIYRAIGAHAHVRRLSAGRSSGLTAREAEVYALVRDGMSNRAIADRLVLSERTVEHHVAAIYAKLGVRTRSELIASAAGAARTIPR
jgi:DNA-binding CsgD family transcriptional regulator/tetratricopeptide (TPR) repeat protein